MTSKPRFLLTGGRSPVTLDLARKLATPENAVYAADSDPYFVCRFTRAVKMGFVVPSCRFDENGFVDALIKIIKDQGITHLIPTCEEVLVISKHRECFPCTVFCAPFLQTKALHNKFTFIEKLRASGFCYPKTALLKSKEEVDALTPPFVIKACYSRASQQVFIVKSKKEIPSLPPFSQDNPWIAQQYISGKQFCSYTICHKGRVTAYALYPVHFSINGTSCLNFRHVEVPAIRTWTQRFVQKENYTGQIAFDFIVNDKDDIFAIECNPRSTSGIHLFNFSDRIDLAFTGQTKMCITPNPKVKRQIAIGMAYFGWKTVQKGFLKTFLTSKDVIFSLKDPLPFFLQPVIFGRYWMQSRKMKSTIPAAFTYDLDWEDRER